MSGPQTITHRHLDRLAIVYVRQSTLVQVREHTESTARQYALADDAARLGWCASAIVTIDTDLGMSGRSASGRTGFQELVSRVCIGEVGAIFGLEISRLARSSADLQRLLEFCSLSDTLIVDADGIYDLRNFNACCTACSAIRSTVGRTPMERSSIRFTTCMASRVRVIAGVHARNGSPSFRRPTRAT
jgi:hypothetical protein